MYQDAVDGWNLDYCNIRDEHDWNQNSEATEPMLISRRARNFTRVTVASFPGVLKSEGEEGEERAATSTSN